MFGKFEDGQNYEFYVGLTDRILDLVRRLGANQPGAFEYRGMNFSHVFEALLYFATVLDAPLNEMFDAGARGRTARRGGVFGSDLAALVAADWFGEERARAYRKAETSLHPPLRRVVRMVRWLSAISAARPVIDEGHLPERCEVLFYGRSTRFVRYLAPLAPAFAGRHAFVVPAGAHDVQAALDAEGKPFLSAPAAHAGLRPPGALIGRYASYLGFLADGMEAALLRLRPRVVVLAEGNSPDDEVINQVGRKLGIPVVCIQQGWSPIFHPGFCNLSYDSMLVWGQGFADLLKPTNPHQKFIPTGNFALTSGFRPPLTKPLGVLFFHQDLDRGLGGVIGSQMNIALAERIARARPDVPVYFRPHPLVPLDSASKRQLTRWPNVIIQKAADVSLDQALSIARVSVSIYSTTILESIAAGTVPIIFNMTTMPHYCPDVAAKGAGLELRTLDDAVAAIDRLLSDDLYLSSFTEAMARFAEYYFCARGTDAIVNVIDALGRAAGRPLMER
jgi:hypothetical protein